MKSWFEMAHGLGEALDMKILLGTLSVLGVVISCNPAGAAGVKKGALGIGHVIGPGKTGQEGQPVGEVSRHFGLQGMVAINTLLR